MSCRGYVYLVIKRIRKVLCLFTSVSLDVIQKIYNYKWHYCIRTTYNVIRKTAQYVTRKLLSFNYRECKQQYLSEPLTTVTTSVSCCSVHFPLIPYVQYNSSYSSHLQDTRTDNKFTFYAHSRFFFFTPHDKCSNP